MNFDTFILKCQEIIHGEFEVLRTGDRYVETDHGKLRIVKGIYEPEAVDSVEYKAIGIDVKFMPYRDYEGNYNFESIIQQLTYLEATRWMARHREIDAIEMHIRELEKIGKAPVTTVQSVSEIKAVPITGYEKIMERRCSSRRMDLFISENVLYVPPETEDSNFGHIQVGNPRCDIMRVEPIIMGNKIVEFLRGCTVLEGLEITVAYFDFQRRKTNPCVGHVQSAEFRLSSTTNALFAVWFCLLDNAHLTMTCGEDETSTLAGKLITAYLEPIQLGLDV